VRERILRSPRVCIDYEVTNIKYFLVVTTCLKCHEYGHITAHCRNEARCRNCDDKSHKKQDCPSKDKKVDNSRKKMCGAKIQSVCPHYKLGLQRVIDRFDYGQ